MSMNLIPDIALIASMASLGINFFLIWRNRPIAAKVAGAVAVLAASVEEDVCEICQGKGVRLIPHADGVHACLNCRR
jgi:hypothetical protein